MKKLIAGNGVKGAESFSGSCGFCDFSVLVKKGHEECGDSAFAWCGERIAAAGVFDGVSGEAGAAAASSAAAAAAMESLMKAEKADEKALKAAIIAANSATESGYTTAVILIVSPDGSFAVAGVGDSPAYSISAKGAVSLELPLGRAVGDGDSILKFLHFRSMVTSVLGRSGIDLALHSRSGRLRKGEMIILASDGLSDNLFFSVKDGYVSDTAGTADLKRILGEMRNPAAIAAKLAKTVSARLAKGKAEKKGSLLVPKNDDVAIAALRFK
jgi:serine/threonine protein phosphatase PrpC